MTDLSTMPTRELCEWLIHLGEKIDTAAVQKLGMESLPSALRHTDEAARRLSRYAPVKIDSEEAATWPSMGKEVEVFDTAFAKWMRGYRGEDDRYYRSCGHIGMAATFWREINNEPPK